MPASVIDFQVSDVCSGGGHATVTMRKDGSPIGSRRFSIASMKEAMIDADPKAALWDVALELIRLADPASVNDVKTTINNMTITVEY